MVVSGVLALPNSCWVALPGLDAQVGCEAGLQQEDEF
jgi:hypothetical protein